MGKEFKQGVNNLYIPIPLHRYTLPRMLHSCYVSPVNTQHNRFY